MLTPSQRLQFDLLGYVVLPQLLDAAACVALVEMARTMPIDAACASERQVVLRNPAWSHRQILEIAMDPRLRGAAEDVIGGESRLEETQFLIFPADSAATATAGSAPVGGDWRWHRGLSPDYGSFESGGHYHCLFVKVLLYLSPQGEGTGVVPGSHRQHVALSEFEQLFEPDMHRRVPTQSGDALIFGETLIHSSPPRPLAAQRMVLVIGYAAPFMRSWSRETAPPPQLCYALTPEERRFVYGEARYNFRGEIL